MPFPPPASIRCSAVRRMLNRPRRCCAISTIRPRFAGAFPLPNAARDDPAFADNVYWRGRIWPNVNYLVWLGLQRAGQTARARRLAAESHAMFDICWQRDRIAGENYNADTGEVLDQGDTDPFYIWAGLLPLMAVEEICAISPWEGWCLTNGPDTHLGPARNPDRPGMGQPASGRDHAGHAQRSPPRERFCRPDQPDPLRGGLLFLYPVAQRYGRAASFPRNRGRDCSDCRTCRRHARVCTARGGIHPKTCPKAISIAP